MNYQYERIHLEGLESVCLRYGQEQAPDDFEDEVGERNVVHDGQCMKV